MPPFSVNLYCLIISYCCVCSPLSAGAQTRNIEKVPESKEIKMPETVFIKGGTYRMGNEENIGGDEMPLRYVTVGDFNIGKYEITGAEYRAFCLSKGRKMPNLPLKNWDDSHPIVGVSWGAANSYCKWLSQQTGKKCRLPTEAEWEYAARGGGKEIRYAWGNGKPKGKRGASVAGKKIHDQYPDRDIFEGYEDGFETTAPVGSFEPNKLDLYDMSGNVWEWCYDWYGSYADSAETNPVGAIAGDMRVCRGGDWCSRVVYTRCSYRGKMKPTLEAPNIGFRIVVEADPIAPTTDSPAPAAPPQK